MALVTTASNDAQGIADVVQKISYPSPFFDIARKYIPLNIKEMFTWTQYFYAISSVIHPIVNKMSEYPVTDILYGDIDDNAKKAWKKILEQSIDIKSTLIETHCDYFVYGNGFLLFHDPFVRYLICGCGHRVAAKSIRYRYVQQSGVWHFEGHCDKCGQKNSKFKFEDVLVRNRSRAKVTRVSPLNIEIEHNEFNGETEYIYKIPSSLKKSVLSGTKIVLDSLDSVVLDAIAKNKDVRLDRDKLYHFKRATISGLWKGWGTPPLLPVLKDVHYHAILRKANEALALQRIVPLSILYPAQQGDVSPFQHLNLAGWRGKVEDELGKWRRDPNYVPVMPIPLGYQTLFSEAKQLMVTQEQELVSQGIASGLGVPIEFIRGGLSWSGSSVSLRILENSFLRLRSHDLNFINNHLIPKLSRIYHLPKIEVSFTKFKMADDIQAKTQAIGLMQNGYVSRKTVLEQEGYDSEQEVRQMEREHISLNAVQNNDAIARQELENILQIMRNRNGIISQFDGQNLSSELQKVLTNQNKDEVKAKLDDVAEQYALILLSQESSVAFETLKRMSQDMPNLYSLILAKMRAFQVKPPQQAPVVKGPDAKPAVIGEAPQIGENVVSLDQEEEPQESLPEKSMPRRAVGGV